MSGAFSEQEITRELAGGEKLLWTGRPRQGLLLRPADALLIPFSLLWCGFAIFWEASVIRGGAPWFFKLWGIPFVLVGLHFVAGRFFVDSYERSRTSYGLTNERIIIVAGLLRKTVKSLTLRMLSDISISERPDGSGTIVLGPSGPYGWFGATGWPGTKQNAPPTLDGIERARFVYEQIRQAQKTAA